jgi:hypothetical protein
MVRPDLIVNGTVFCDFRIQIVGCVGEDFFSSMYLAVEIMGFIAAACSIYLLLNGVFYLKLPFYKNGKLNPVTVGAILIFIYSIGCAVHALLLRCDCYTNYVQREVVFIIPILSTHVAIIILLESMVMTLMDTYPKVADLLPNLRVIYMTSRSVMVYLVIYKLSFALALGILEDQNSPLQDAFFIAYFAVYSLHLLILIIIVLLITRAFFQVTWEMYREEGLSVEAQKTKLEISKVYSGLIGIACGFGMGFMCTVILSTGKAFVIPSLSEFTCCMMIGIPMALSTAEFLTWVLLSIARCCRGGAVSSISQSRSSKVDLSTIDVKSLQAGVSEDAN